MNGSAFQRPQVIVCMPTTYRRPPVRGVSQQKADCGHQVWVSPVTWAMREEGGVETACYACCPSGTHTGVHPLHMEEAKAHGMTEEEATMAAAKLDAVMPFFRRKR